MANTVCSSSSRRRCAHGCALLLPPDGAASLSVGLQRRLGEDRRGRAAAPEKPLQSSGCGGGGATLRTVRTAGCISPIIWGAPNHPPPHPQAESRAAFPGLPGPLLVFWTSQCLRVELPLPTGDPVPAGSDRHIQRKGQAVAGGPAGSTQVRLTCAQETRTWMLC